MPEIELDLSHHCIETAIKRAYNRMLSEYFSVKGGNVELEDQLALLQQALTTFDFSSLRAAHKELAGKNDSRITLKSDHPHPPTIIINDRLIDTDSFLKP